MAAPQPYISAADAKARLSTKWGLNATLNDGAMLASSMRLDEQGPFLGAKLDPYQERAFPRTYGFPVGGYTGIYGYSGGYGESYPGAFLSNYEGVVPDQVIDWVCLEAYRLVALTPERFTRTTSASSGGGGSVSVSYDPTQPGLVDLYQQGLLGPFLLRHAHTSMGLGPYPAPGATP